MKRIERILLLNAPIYSIEEKHFHAANYACYPPLGLVSIASRVKNTFPEIEVKIIDGELSTIDEIKSEIIYFRPQVLGISTLTTTYLKALEYAEFAKNAGVQHIVLGNDHSSFFPELILKKRKFIDYIIVGDNGEIDFCNFIYSLNTNSNVFQNVSNIYGRQTDNIIHSDKNLLHLKVINSSTNDIPNFDILGLEELQKYWRIYNNDFGMFHKSTRRPLTINNAKGCSNGKNRCLYCHIYDLKPTWGNSKFFWDSIYLYKNRYNANLFFEVCDNFSGMKVYIDSLIETMPNWFSDSDIEIIVYSRAHDIYKDKTLVEKFKRLHITRINIGLEAGNNSSLRFFRKGHPEGLETYVNKKAVEIIANSGIQIHSSFILGSLGETYESIQDTRTFIEWLTSFKNIVAIEISALYPVPNSPSWDILIGKTNSSYYDNLLSFLENIGLDNLDEVWKKTRNSFQNQDVIDVKYASKLWLDNFTFLSSKVINNEIFELNNLVKSGKRINTGSYI